MAKKYIDAEKLIAEINRKIGSIENRLKEDTTLISEAMLKGSLGTYESIERLITSLQQEQPDFPTTDEEIEIFLATHPKVEVPNKYKTPDWLWKKQDQLEVKWHTDEDYDETDKGRFVLGSVGIGYNGYYIPYSDLLKLPKEE